MKQATLDNSIFIQNRASFVAQMAASSIAVFVSNDEFPTNGDALYKFKQNSDLYWLTGIIQPGTVLVLYPDNLDKKNKEVLFLTRPNEAKEKWDGKLLRTENAQAISGITRILWLDSMEGLLQKWIHAAENIYLSTNENDRKDTKILTWPYRFAHELKTVYPLHNYKRSAPILKKLRSIKSAEEIEIVKKAIDITSDAFKRVCDFVKPGVMEYEIEAEILHEFISKGSSGEAYSSIIASGDNARILHYIDNNNECKDGDLILMDFGAAYGGYNADLSRTIPVNGKFTPRQKEVYNACLHLHNFSKSLLAPGITLEEYTHKVADEATQQFLLLGLLKEEDVKNENKDELETRPYRKYLYHGISHHLGIDVHDLGTTNQSLQAGMLLTVEPGIYIEEEKIGVRIENNVWLTENGNIDLMQHIPITIEEIEEAINRRYFEIPY